MKYLFIDNYRGFTNTFIPLREVNFLVGENSTGKTSVLSIINLISNHKFLFEQQFNDADVQLGNFRDIISYGSQNKSNFSLGIIDTNEEDPRRCFVFLATFSEKEGLPAISKFHYCYEKREIVIYLKETIQYKDTKIDKFNNDIKYLQSFITNWTIGTKSLRGFQKLKDTRYKHMPYANSIMYLIQIVELEYSDENRFPFHYFIQNTFRNMTWLAPIRSKPKRTYDDYKTEFSSDGSHTPYLVRKLLGTSGTCSKFNKFIREFGENSGLMDSIKIRKYGRDEIISPFELSIGLNNKSLNIKYVGYGVSQILPVIVEIYNGKKRTWFIIQQPEVHLHPKAQAALGDVIYKMAKQEKKNFLIETHSDYMIDRFRKNYLNKKAAIDAQVLFFNRKGIENTVDAIYIKNSGEYDTNQPKEFREFFINEELSNLGIK